MDDLGTLITYWGRVEDIPKEELAEAGYKLKDGEVIHLSDDETEEEDFDSAPEESFPEHLERDIRAEKDKDPFFSKLRKDKQARLEEILSGPVGGIFNKDEREFLIESLEEGNYFHKNDDELEREEEPEEIMFLNWANSYLRANPNEIKAKWVVEATAEEFLDYLGSGKYGYVEWEIPSKDKLSELFGKILVDKQVKFKNQKILQEVIDEFEEKYGPKNFCGGAPLLSYAFRKVVLGEKEPKEFWGKSLFDKKNELIKKFKGIKDIGKFANLIFSEEVDFYRDYVFNQCDSSGIIGLEAIVDGTPNLVDLFEKRLDEGTAIAYLKSRHFDCGWEDESTLGSEWITDVLTAIYNEEFKEQIQEIKENYKFLDKAKSFGKKNKLIRLCHQFSDFEEIVRANAQGDFDYKYKLEQNKKTTEELKELGIDTTIFYKGIGTADFEVSGGISRSREEVKEEYISQYHEFLNSVFEDDVLHKPESLESKLKDSLPEDTKIPEGTSVKDYVKNLTDENLVSKVCNVCSSYLSRRQNVKDAQRAGAVSHHFRTINSFLKRKFKSNGNGDNQYTIKLASKNPFTDIDIGNDGGCCIGIYGKEEGEESHDSIEGFIDYLQTGALGIGGEVGPNGCYMPFYLKDNATQFVEIYKGNERVGMALMFAGKNEKNEPVLKVNSLELSDRLRGDSNKNIIIEETMRYIQDYSKKTGFRYCIMSGHSYNSAVDYVGDSPDFKEFNKIDNWDEDYYSDSGNIGILETKLVERSKKNGI